MVCNQEIFMDPFSKLGVGKLWSVDQIHPTTIFGKMKIWHTAMAICVHIAYGRFEATTAQLGSWDTDCMPSKPKIFVIWPNTEKVYVSLF